MGIADSTEDTTSRLVYGDVCGYCDDYLQWAFLSRPDIDLGSGWHRPTLPDFIGISADLTAPPTTIIQLVMESRLGGRSTDDFFLLRGR